MEVFLEGVVFNLVLAAGILIVIVIIMVPRQYVQGEVHGRGGSFD